MKPRGPFINWQRFYRTEAWQKQGKRCVWCLRSIPHYAATAEHFKPRSMGGLVNRQNIGAACKPCNSVRGNLKSSVFKKMLNGSLPAPSFDVQLIAASRRINKRADKAVKRIKRYGCRVEVEALT